MVQFDIRPATACRWDLVVLAEVTGTGYDVAYSVARSGLEASVVTALADTTEGHLLADQLRDTGIGQAHIRWITGDGRAGLRGSAGPWLKPGDVPWSILFAADGARWFHTSGMFAALSHTTLLVVAEAMTTARRCGTVVSYDPTCPPGHAPELNASLANLADVLVDDATPFMATLFGALLDGQDPPPPSEVGTMCVCVTGCEEVSDGGNLAR
jgi:2-dehydro-3-deoxygluconokinase